MEFSTALVTRSWFGIGPAGGITHRVEICVQKLESPVVGQLGLSGETFFGDMRICDCCCW